MINSWEEYLFLGLTLSVFASSIFSGDWRIRIASVTLLGSWVLLQVAGFLFGPWKSEFIRISSYLFVNLVVIYILIQIHYRRLDETREPVWPIFIMGLEFIILLANLMYWMIGWYYYIYVVDLVFGLELIVVTCAGIYQTGKRLFESGRSGSEQRGL